MVGFAGPRSKAEVLKVLHRAGLPAALIEEIAAQLPDPVDLDRDGPLLASYGVTHTFLINQMGASP